MAKSHQEVAQWRDRSGYRQWSSSPTRRHFLQQIAAASAGTYIAGLHPRGSGNLVQAAEYRLCHRHVLLQDICRLRKSIPPLQRILSGGRQSNHVSCQRLAKICDERTHFVCITQPIDHTNVLDTP